MNSTESNEYCSMLSSMFGTVCFTKKIKSKDYSQHNRDTLYPEIYQEQTHHLEHYAVIRPYLCFFWVRGLIATNRET